jgi:tripartite-type tricarboxylate transporter receptor subunit TctC
VQKPHRLAAVAAGLLALTLTACAQTGGGGSAGGTPDTWPAGETMKLLVGYAAGGTTDAMARSLAASLEKELGVRIQVENQDGAGGQVEYTELANSKPDGLTMGTLNYPTILTTILDKEKGATYTLDDFQPLANHVNDPRITIVHPDSPFQNAHDLVEYAKANPGELRGATSGLSGGGHFSMIKLEQATGADFTPVHFNTGQADAKAAFLGRHVDVYFASIGDGLEVVKSGSGRALGVMDDQRSPLLPDIPTYQEQGIDIQEAGMRGYALPAGVPEERVQKLAQALEKIITSPEHQEELAKLSLQADFMGPQDYTEWLKAQEADVATINEISKTDE